MSPSSTVASDNRVSATTPTSVRHSSDWVELRAHIWVAWAAVGCILLLATETDPDVWGHLRFGLDWWRTGTLPSVDPYSFTQGRPWVNHEWLSEAAMAGAYRIGGTIGLVALKAAILGGVLALLARRLSNRRLSSARRSSRWQ